jgi:F-type H+-transporting ATPase subunit delta
MREPTVSRNYAEVLAALAGEAKDLEGWGEYMSDVANVCTSDETLSRFLASPRVTVAQKSRIIGSAFAKKLPEKLVRFLQAVVMHRRQHLLSEIAIEYHALIDQLSGRVHAQVQVASEASADRKAAIAKQLGRITGLEVVPHFTVQPRIMGGVIVKIGDIVMDGSVARRLASLRLKMLGSAAH